MVTKQTLIDGKGFVRTINRLAHEIIERNKGADSIGIVGIRTRGDLLARRIAHKISLMENISVPIGSLDITLYRDDLRGKLNQPQLKMTDILFDIQDKNIILVDDVLFTGRTVRSALNALIDLGRPASIQLAVFVDRGHRELPIKADFIGKSIPTSQVQEVQVKMSEIDDEDAVFLLEKGENV